MRHASPGDIVSNDSYVMIAVVISSLVHNMEMNLLPENSPIKALGITVIIIAVWFCDFHAYFMFHDAHIQTFGEVFGEELWNAAHTNMHLMGVKCRARHHQ
jgi:hypothetical protein